MFVLFFWLIHHEIYPFDLDSNLYTVAQFFVTDFRDCTALSSPPSSLYRVYCSLFFLISSLYCQMLTAQQWLAKNGKMRHEKCKKIVQCENGCYEKYILNFQFFEKLLEYFSIFSLISE